MPEHVAQVAYYAGIHLTYASIVAGAVWALTCIRGTSAATKYWMWVLTVANFIVPTGAVVNSVFASVLGWAAPGRLGIIGDIASTMTEGRTATLTAAIWLIGAAAMTARLVARLRFERHATVTGPAVSGLLRPRIVLPHGINRMLSRDELEAVVLHERTHVRRRDNLIRLVYEVALCLVWFHPLLWLAGRRIAVYRELSCDESVTARTNGRVLISALAKLAAPENVSFLQATASAHLSERLMLLESPRRSTVAANLVVAGLFASILAAGVFGTVAHTACCFLRTR
jgi:beta-lactamase regulating signal transducer with metallopeptidase domain